ncbi:pilus assembly protein [Fictibacillus nanhaiensis]|uniref:TadE/TadG family type IV pilus assembly protein n=1 Tax=Fictibacillus nanhaiensis TaxID=742169 RepID=UPI001C9468FB|nr:TadE/TadG family type IV pilus assembly protein [Fictibacillus nanhaiensis]MBY6037451.1 pilus assembly protein [Fictibacillus nanhaiensis]
MRNNEKGQSLVEMALVLPILLMLVIGIIDFGKLFYTYMHLHLATQETVRLGGLGKDDTEIRAFAKDYVQVKDSSLLQIGITPDSSTRDSGQYVTVTLSYPHTFMTPGIGRLFGDTIPVETNSTIRVE